MGGSECGDSGWEEAAQWSPEAADTHVSGEAILEVDSAGSDNAVRIRDQSSQILPVFLTGQTVSKVKRCLQPLRFVDNQNLLQEIRDSTSKQVCKFEKVNLLALVFTSQKWRSDFCLRGLF